MKNLKKILAILLIASMILTTNATMLFATEVNQGTEEQIESSTEEIIFEEEESEDDIRRGDLSSEPEEEEAELEEEAEETTVGAKLGEPEEYTRRGERLSEPALDEEEAEEEEEVETTVGANVHGARPEDEENSTGAKLSEPELFGAGAEEPEEETTSANEEETLNLENKNDNPLYGEPDFAVEIITMPDRLEYYATNKFDPTGLVVRVRPSGGDPYDVAYIDDQSRFGFDPSPATPLTADINQIKCYFDEEESMNSIEVKVKPSDPLEPDNTFYMVLSKNKLIAINNDGQRVDDINVNIFDIVIENEIKIPSGKEVAGWYPLYIPDVTTKNELYDIYDPNHTDIDINTLEDAYERWDSEYENVAWGLVFRNKSNPNPNPTPTYVDDDGGDDPSDPNVGPLGKQYEYTDYGSGIPSLKDDLSLLLWLMSFPENMNRPKTIARDVYGNVGYGRWLHVPGTMTWYFFVGDFDANGIKPNSGFIVSGKFKLDWDGQEKWFRFDGSGVLVLGWYQEGNRISFLQNNPLDHWYGEEVTGSQVIDGVAHTFDASGALIN